MVTFRAVTFPQGRPKEFEPVGDPFEAPTLTDAGIFAAARVGSPEDGRAYWLEYLDGAGGWQSAGALTF
jgi:hypothetical protein